MPEAVSTDQAPRPDGFYSQGIREGRLVFVTVGEDTNGIAFRP